MNDPNDPATQQELNDFIGYATARLLENLHGLVTSAKTVYKAWGKGNDLAQAMDELVEVLEAIGVDLEGDEDVKHADEVDAKRLAALERLYEIDKLESLAYQQSCHAQDESLKKQAQEWYVQLEVEKSAVMATLEAMEK